MGDGNWDLLKCRSFIVLMGFYYGFGLLMFTPGEV